MVSHTTKYEIKISAEHLSLLIELWIRSGFVYPHGVRDLSIIRLAVEDLIQRGKIDVVRHFLEKMHKPLNNEVFDCLFRMTSALPAGYNERSFLNDHDPEDEYSLFKGLGQADSLIVVFTGQMQRFNYPLPLVHGLLEATGCPILYLKDNSRSVFAEGIGGAASHAALAARINDSLQQMNCRRSLVLGSSSGSFAALVYAKDIAASHVICLAGPTCIEPDDSRPQIQRMRQVLERANIEPDAVNYLPESKQCRIRYYYGAGNARDGSYARHLAASRPAEVVAIRGHENHAVLDVLCAMGSFQADLGAAVAGTDFPSLDAYPSLFQPFQGLT